MRTTDFSRAPRIGQAGAQFVGATKFTGPLAFIGLVRRWFPLVRRMKRSAGYRGHRIWQVHWISPLFERFDEGHQHIEPIAFRASALGVHQTFDLAKRASVVSFTLDRCDVHAATFRLSAHRLRRTRDAFL